MARLDASYERGEYARKGIVWKEVESNIKRLKKEAPHVNFSLSPTLSIFNAYNITDFHKEWVEKGYILGGSLRINLLHGPKEYCIKNLPDRHKVIITKRFKEHIKWLNTLPDFHYHMPHDNKKDFQDILKFINSKPDVDEYKFWFTKHFWLDKGRNENFFDVFPEYSDMKEDLLTNTNWI